MGSRKTSAILCGALASYWLLSPVYAVWHFDEYASTGPLLVRYVLVPMAFALTVLCVGLRAPPRVATGVGIYGLSVLMGLFLFEALLTLRSIPVRLSMLGQLSQQQSEAMAQREDMVRGFTLAQLNQLSGATKLREAILSGFPKTQVVLCSGPDSIVSYRADRYGFNNPDALYETTHLESMLLGDSFVEGFCLRPEENMVSQLRRKGVHAIGMGIRGNGPLTELATLGRFGPMFKPRHVFMVFFEGNDWENLQAELGRPWLLPALVESADFGTPSTANEMMQRAKSMMDDINSRPVTAADLFTKTEILRNFIALQQTFTRLGLIFPKATPAIPEFGEALRRAKTIAMGWSGSFTLVYVPQLDRYIGPLSAAHAYEPLRTRVLGSASAAGVDVIDLTSALEKELQPETFYGPDGHFNSRGAAFAATILARHLRDLGVVPSVANIKP